MERGEYAEAARLLEAVQQLAAHFAAFGSVPKVLLGCKINDRTLCLSTCHPLKASTRRFAFDAVCVSSDVT